MLEVVSLFAGIGGFDLGLERAGGFRTTLMCEIEPFQRAVLRKHWPHVPQHDDIRTLNKFVCDVVCGGFPCQPFSTAARGRNNAVDLWPHMFKFVFINRPKYVIAENVVEAAIRMAERQLVGIGYTVTVRHIDGVACGAPHARSRWWLVAHPHEDGEFCSALNAEVAELPQLCENVWGATNYARVIRVPNGLPDRLHRVGALGNAVIPFIPEAIGRAINRVRGKANDK